MKRLTAVGLVAMMVSVAGCATSFSGSAKVDGPKQCRMVCDNWGMDLAGMVAMGEYTNGCICKVKGESLSLNGIGSALLMSSAGAAGGTTGVIMKEREKN
jgi:hypothetical protein